MTERLKGFVDIATIGAAILAIAACFFAWRQLRKSTKIASQDLFLNCTEQLRARLSDMYFSDSEEKRNFRTAETLNSIEIICCMYIDGAFIGVQKTLISDYITKLLALVDSYYRDNNYIEKIIHSKDTFIHITRFIDQNRELYEKAKSEISKGN